jgi:RNA polymerase sigma factor (sigma-70 family)
VSERTDTELVAGVLAGDRDAFAAVYDRYADRLHDFCWSVLRDRDEAADAVQDTFVLAAQRLAQLNDPERLRPWLYAVARSVALRRVRDRRRVVLDEVGDMADTDPGPHRAAEQEALRELVWTAAGGLSERDRALLDLHLRQGLEGAELGEAMGVSPSHAYVLLSRLRDQVERSLGALLIARLGREDCTELDSLLSGWDGKFSPILRKRVARHVDQCDVCSDRRRIAVSPWALLAAVPPLAAPLFLRDRVMSEVQLASAEQTAVTQRDGSDQDGPDQDGDSGPDGGSGQGAGGQGAGGVGAGGTLAAIGAFVASRRGKVVAAAAAVLALLAVGASVVYLRSVEPTEGKPLALDNALPVTTDETTTDTTTGPFTTTPTTGPTTTTTTRPPRRTTTTQPRRTTTTNVVQPPPPPPPPPTTTGDTVAPVINSADARPPEFWAQYCERDPAGTTVVANVTDNVGVASVILSWPAFGDNPAGSVAMSPDGDSWFASIRGFYPGKVNWTVNATDAAGNAAKPRSGGLTVLDCPVG